MIVCHCRVVSDREVRDAIASGATEACALAEVCGVGSRCGGCLPELRRLLREHGLPAEQDLTAAEIRRRLARASEPAPVEAAV
ncbi:MAG: (2Fe-2S)-binding protein [Actinobacteria bacterium]|nr:(2Fe-2S)-binding protein [Actinomycetota bacterium]